jgi:hypothetical protein
LSFPVRVRWLGPFGLETEVSRTFNASRGGLLIFSNQPRGESSPVWVTFPYDAEMPSTEPEIPARVARCDASPGGLHAIGIRFERGRPRNPQHMRTDRRRHARIPLALFVRILHTECAAAESVIHLNAPWPEETMTVDVSPLGLFFCTLRTYSADECLSLSLSDGRWLEGGKHRARVVRVAGSKSDSPLAQVAAEFLP